MKKLHQKNIKLFMFGIFIVVFLTFLIFSSKSDNNKLLIAPMIGGIDSCLFKKSMLIHDTPNSAYTKLCLKDESSPSKLVEATLNNIAPNNAISEKYKLGYTLYIPLLKLFDIKDSGYEINKEFVRRISKTIENVDRPVILYLFSNHFSVDSPIEDILAKNPENMLRSAKGQLSIDKYYGSNIYPWSFVNTDNEITHLREEAFNAVLDDICKIPGYALRRIEAITMLGELHHMFPDFQGGMGFSEEYIITDYSKNSSEQFREFISKKYSTISKLNNYLGSNYSNFKDISPPSKNIRNEPLNNFLEHIDAYAHGVLPISGWVSNTSRNQLQKYWIQIFDNGEFLARVPVEFGRQDVIAAHPELQSSDVGWQFNYNFSKIKPGIHNIDILLEQENKTLSKLASRSIAIMEKTQSTPRINSLKDLPSLASLNDSIIFHVDNPLDSSSYYFNPLALLWQDFRKTQVTRYLKHFGDIAKSKCFSSQLIYSHQILPFVNPGWDETKFAVGQDLAVPPDMNLGVSLYGEASYGTSFFDWFRGRNRMTYGITEFHPLKAMNAKELDLVLSQHQKNNAKFLSFFVESAGLDEDSKNKPNIFSFDKKNKNVGSNVLFQSMQELLQ